MMDNSNAVLTSTELFVLCLTFAVGMLGAWLTPFFFLRKKPQALTTMVLQGYLLRALTVTVVVIVAGLLAVVERLSAEAAAILSGVAGYVLGSGKGHPCEERREGPEGPEDTASPDEKRAGAHAKGVAEDKAMKVTDVFKPAGEDVQLLIVHSSENKRFIREFRERPHGS